MVSSQALSLATAAAAFAFPIAESFAPAPRAARRTFSNIAEAVDGRSPSTLAAATTPFYASVAEASGAKKSGSKKSEKSPIASPSATGDNFSKIVVIAGSTGYIGRAVVRESVRLGYDTVALVRDASFIASEEGQSKYGEPFRGARVVQADVEDESGLADLVAKLKADSADENGVEKTVDAIVSCLASPLGTKREAEAIDYRATLNCLNAGRDSRTSARHFVLLSAFCVRNPLLELQRQKLRFESELTAQSDMTYSIVRPTAFFKSVSGQLEGILGGAPYVLFGDGAVTRCNPIAEEELAEFMMGSLDPSAGRTNKIMNVGGPDEPLTNQMLGEMMYSAAGMEPKFVYAPTWIFDYVIDGFQKVADWRADGNGGERDEWWDDAAETARIGKYYAVEDMLTTDPSEKYGKIKMQDHYDKIAREGQDQFTPVRATAVIARVLESLPAVSVSLPVGYALVNPKAMETVMAPVLTASNGGALDFSMILASLGSN